MMYNAATMKLGQQDTQQSLHPFTPRSRQQESTQQQEGIRPALRGMEFDHQDKDNSQQEHAQITPATLSTPRRNLTRLAVVNTQQWNSGCTQLKVTIEPSTRANRSPLPWSFCKQNTPPMKCYKSRCQSLQMRTLNGFSNSSAWADGFTAESEIPRLGQIVSLPNPRCRMGFQLKPSFAHRALLPNSIIKMNSP
jgi:hypothetical protein